MKQIFLAVLLSNIVIGAGANDDIQNIDQINYSFNGNDTRLGVGVNENGEFVADFLKSFKTTFRSNWMTQAWYSDGAGGVELDYHWISGIESVDQLIGNDSLRINKLFIAIDQNIWDDRKLTLGGGQEYNNYFWNLNLSKATTGSRLVSQESDFFNDVLSGVIDGREFIQSQTIETITRSYEQPYDWGIGARLGKYFESQNVRLIGGLDYEKGDFSSNQLSASVDIEKYFYNTGHSIALHIEQAKKGGDFEIDKNDTRANLLYRYDFGKTFQPTVRYEEIKIVDEVALAKLKEDYKKVVQNEIDLESMAFFNLDSYELRDDTKVTLKGLVESIKTKDLASKINIIGHTCYLGSDDYNQVLSEKRAHSAQKFFIENGISAEIIQASGKGESEPEFDNSTSDFIKNRRVAISFLTIESKQNIKEVPADKVPFKWVKRPVKTPPSWLERALKSPLKHKRNVDVYRSQEQETKETLGDVVFLNQAPAAVDDSIMVQRNSAGIVVDVLSNDSDEDNDSLSIVDIIQPTNGQVINNGNSVTYIPSTGYIGDDSFDYTIDDGNGDQATATVYVVVKNNAPTANDDTASTITTAPVTIDVLANDVDSDGENLSIISVQQPANGTVVINSDGTLTYTANEGFIGQDTFTYIMTDADGSENSARVTITVNPEPLPVNNPPVAVDDMYDVAMNGTLTFKPLLNDSDPDGDEISVLSVDTSSLSGQLTINSDGSMTYTANFLFRGNDTFTYTIVDEDGLTSTATVTLCVAD